MRRKNRLWVAALLPIVLTGCVDDKYDLSDVETTVRVNVKDLVIPVNIDRIDLGTILDLDGEDRVKVIDGKYAIVEEGTFNSDAMQVSEITLRAPHIDPSETVITIGSGSAAAMSRAVSDAEYNLVSNPSEYSFNASFVSEYILSIDKLGCDLSLRVNIVLSGMDSYVTGLTFRDIVLQLPKGLDLTETAGGTYDAASGELSLPARKVEGASLTLDFKATGLDFAQSGGTYDYSASTVTLPGSLYIKQGKAVVSVADIKQGVATLPTQITLRTSYDLSDATVNSFTGKIRYDIDGSSLSDVDLSDLPDVLAQPGTDISFVNPAIYLQVENPLQRYGVYARTGLDITAYHGEEGSTYSLDNPYFQIGPGNADGIYNFCLSPSMPAVIDADYAGAEHVGFASLSRVLSGNGLPQRLSIDLKNPEVPAQTVTDFRLGEPLGQLHGKYKFVAPLEFTDGSTIVYTDKIDGWAGEDLSKVTVTALDVTLTVSTDIPVAVDFTGYPIDAAGHRINNVEIVGASVPANASSYKLTISITGEVKGVDGIEFEARARSVQGMSPLSPDMHITLSDVRPKVSGYYEKEL
ncbi:MAG: hypothetical protein NC043_06190 [Muribaculaceae bacterium]|nr:hypothetical protein [Muribaculaceae bacterium]